MPAKTIHWPELCDSGKLHIKNKHEQPISVWLQKFSPHLISEVEHIIPANGVTEIDVEKTESRARHSLLHFAGENLISLHFECKQQQLAGSELDGGVLTFKRKPDSKNLIRLQNLSHSTNNIKLIFFKRDGLVIESKSISLELNENTTISAPDDWAALNVSSAAKYSAFQLTSDSSQAASHGEPVVTEVDNNVSYFLVTPRNGRGDNFIVKISDEGLLQKARDLIQHPEKEKIVFARVQKGSGGYNRNFSKLTKTHWSWSAAEVTGFDDFGSTNCNGHPQALEDRVDRWVESIGFICFWDYRIKKELTPREVSGASLR